MKSRYYKAYNGTIMALTPTIEWTGKFKFPKIPETWTRISLREYKKLRCGIEAEKARLASKREDG